MPFYPSFAHHSRWISAAMLVCATLLPSPGQAQISGELEKVHAALPAKARVAPEKPRKVLVFSLAKGFVHASIPLGEKTLQLLGEKTGAFTAVVTRDPEYFRPEKLREFDAVIMNSVSGEPFTDPELRESLRSFVHDEGKGLVGIHGATTAFREWPEYGRMIGAYFNTHPWSAGDTVTLKVEEPRHPVAAAFPEPTFTLVEEIYQFHPTPYSRSRLRVLVSLDQTRTDMTKKGIDRFDNDFPVSWVRTHGKGKVFYSSLGHNYHIYSNPVVLQHFLDGIQFALGDLPAPASPRPELAERILLQALPVRLDAIRGYTYGADRTALTHLEHLVREATLYPATRKHFAREIGRRLQETMAESKSTETLVLGQYLSRQLIELGGEESVAALAPFLQGDDPLMAEAAYLALGDIPDEAAVAALRDALSPAPAAYRAGIAGVLGHRRDAKAVDALAKLAAGSDADTTTAEAAILSLGQIGSKEAASALEKLGKNAPDSLHPAIAAARVKCADLLAEEGHEKEAGAIFREILDSEKAGAQRAAAFLGLAAPGDAESHALVARALVGDDAQLQSAAAAHLVQNRDPGATSEVVKALADASPDIQILGLQILAKRGDAGALEFVRAKAGDENSGVRLAAIKALGSVGNESVVELLATYAAAESAQERRAARTSLAGMPSEKADSAILDLLEREREQSNTESAKLRQELVTALQARHAVEAVPALLTAARDSNAGVRMRAFKALAELADGDQAQKLAALLRDAKPKSVQREAEKALVASSQRIADESARDDAAVASLREAKDPAQIAALVRVLGRIGTPDALRVLKEKRASGATDQEVQDALVRAIAEFPSADAFAEALSLARESQSPVQQVLALRGAARMLALPGDRSSTESVRLWSELMDLARRPEEQKMILGEVGATAEPALLSLVIARLDNPDLKQEAVAAAIQLAEATCKANPDLCRDAMEKVAKAADGASQEKAAAILKQIEKLDKK